MSSESLMREPKNRWRVPTRVIDRLLHLLQGHCRHRDPVKRKRLQVVVPACERKHSVVAQLAPGERNGLLRARVWKGSGGGCVQEEVVVGNDSVRAALIDMKRTPPMGSGRAWNANASKGRRSTVQIRRSARRHVDRNCSNRARLPVDCKGEQPRCADARRAHKE
eukprot:TRINITY_DN5405_c0_g1_i1.p1 TRINITY_DN5405_c0_g1~~TRINITY_DN5405_c0_g1_i1.p1  ORF type:complete len:165 (+),score=3.49 TRINITY_DN5405_c0_g1_i1:450-944(+)